HHPDITGPCRCRKPMPGLIEKAIFDFNLDPAHCLLFGDKDSDILAGQACGIFSVKVCWGSGLVSMPNRFGSSLQTKTFP
nr:HAD hydrolase-like protein [Desulfovibrio sp.]